MNVVDLEEELARQAADSPSTGDLRAALTVGIAARNRRRRTVSLLAAAAGVVAIVGGIGIVAAVRNAGSVPPVTPPPGVVRVPDIQVTADSALVALQLAQVETPVSVKIPAGFHGPTWQRTTGSLMAGWYGAAGSREAMAVGTDQLAAPSFGYMITAGDADLAFDDAGVAVTPLSRTIEIAGHRAELRLAPAGSLDALGNPFDRRLTWQLSDGRWIHVWAQGSSEAALTTFAAGITERPDVLSRDLGIGLTLPGYTQDSVWNSTVLSVSNPDVLYLCTPGTDGLALSIAGDLAGAPCLMITAKAQPATPRGATTAVRVAGMTIRVSVPDQIGYRSLPSGGSISVAILGGPMVSAADLAALTASATVDPSVTFDPTILTAINSGTETAVSTR